MDFAFLTQRDFNDLGMANDFRFSVSDAFQHNCNVSSSFDFFPPLHGASCVPLGYPELLETFWLDAPTVTLIDVFHAPPAQQSPPAHKTTCHQHPHHHQLQ